MSETRQELLAAVERAVGRDSPDFAAFSSLLDRGEASELDSLLGEVDDSDYSLADWVAAFVAFDEWLADKGEKRRPLAEMRGYIHCCTFTTAPQLSLPILKVIVNKALTEFGFIAASDPHL